MVSGPAEAAERLDTVSAQATADISGRAPVTGTVNHRTIAQVTRGHQEVKC